MIKKVVFLKLKELPFLIIPIPLRNELFSSWITRTAYAHHTHPHTFINLFLGDSYRTFFGNNIDAILCNSDINTIQKKCNNKINILPLTLKSYAGYLQENIINNGTNKFLTSLRFCPICLREDKVPYYRKYWSVVFYTICLKHQCYMHDKCPQCNKKLNISKMYKNTFSFTFCSSCGFDLKKAHKLPIYSDKKYIQSNQKLATILESGYIQLGDKPIYSFYYFDTITQLAKLILVHRYQNNLDSKKLQYFKIKRSFMPIYYQLSIKEQFIIFGIVMKLFDNYPNNFKEFVKDNQLTHTKLIKDMTYLSFWYTNLLNDVTPRFIPITKFITKEEIFNAKEYLKSKNIPINKANLTRLLGCNFFSIYNKLQID